MTQREASNESPSAEGLGIFVRPITRAELSKFVTAFGQSCYNSARKEGLSEEAAQRECEIWERATDNPSLYNLVD